MYIKHLRERREKEMLRNMNVQAIVDKVLPIFEAHKHEDDIEVEIRLGKHNGSLLFCII